MKLKCADFFNNKYLTRIWANTKFGGENEVPGLKPKNKIKKERLQS